MKFNFSEKLILVTGSTRGIGLGIGRIFLQMGAKVVFNSRNKRELKNLIKEFDTSKAIGIARDVTCPNESRILLEEIHQGIDENLPDIPGFDYKDFLPDSLK